MIFYIERNIIMEQLKNYSESFKFKFEKFLTGCDSIEEMGVEYSAQVEQSDRFELNSLTAKTEQSSRRD